MPTVVIVGGGISGLALAYRLEQRAPDLHVILLEERGRLGGKIGTEQHDGFRVETGPNGFLDSKPSTLALCRDLGLGDRLVAASAVSGRNRYLFLEGRLRKLPTGLLSFLCSGVLSWRAKLRLLTERFRSPLSPGACDESVDAFARRRVGDEVADTLVDAFVTGIHAGDPRLLSVAAAFPRLTDLERRHGSVLRGLASERKRKRQEARQQGTAPPGSPRMWSFAEGLHLLIDSLRDRLHRPPITGVRVRSLRRNSVQGAPGWRVQGEGQEGWDADAVVLTCPAPQQAELVADVDAELAAKIAGIAYNRVVVVALGYRAGDLTRPLDGFGYLSPGRECRDVLGVQWCSSIFPERAPPGLVLLRALCGGWHRPEMVDWDEPRLLAAVRAELAAALDLRAEPVFHHVIRWDRAIPQYHLGHLERVAWIEERVRRYPGLHLAGNAYHGVALNDCVERADVLTEKILR